MNHLHSTASRMSPVDVICATMLPANCLGRNIAQHNRRCGSWVKGSGSRASVCRHVRPDGDGPMPGFNPSLLYESAATRDSLTGGLKRRAVWIREDRS